MTQPRASTGQTPRAARAVGAASLFLVPLLLAPAAATGAPTPLATQEKVAFFDDFASGALDPDRWSLPTTWGLEKTRMKPWDFPTLPPDDTAVPHLSDSPLLGGGRYQNANRSWVETNWIDLTQASGAARMTLYHRYDIDSTEDGAVVMVRTELRGWSLLVPQAGYTSSGGFSGSALVFSAATFDVSPYAGTRLKLAFEIVSGNNGVVGDGWQIQSLTVAYSTIEQLPNIVATSLDILSSGGSKITTGQAGDVLQLTLNMHNSGLATPGRLMPVQFWDGAPGFGRLIGQAAAPPTPSGEDRNASISAVLTAGAHTITAVVDPSGVVPEYSNIDNTAQASVQLDAPAGIDVAILDMWFESGGLRTTGARPGQSVAVNVTLANTGAGNYVGGFVVALSRRNADNTTTLLQNQSVIALASGEVLPVIITFSAFAGNLSLVVTADRDNTVAEARETNNVAERPFVVTDTPPVDLAAEAIQLLSRGVETSGAYEGELIQVVARVRNIGTGPLTDTFTVSIYLGDPDTSGSLLFTRVVPSGLNPNTTVEVRGTWVAQIGVRALYAYADLGHEIFEADEQNNKALDTITVLPDARANLVLKDVRFTVFGREVNTTSQGAPVNVVITIQNTGVNTSVGGYLSSSQDNPWVRPATAPLVRVPLPAQIARNGQVDVNFTWTAVTGATVFFLVADYQLAVDETVEFDNIAVRTFVVTADSPDLVAGSVSVKAKNVEVGTLYPQLNVTVRAEVTNSGIASVESPFVVELWAGEPGGLGSVRLANRTVQPPFASGDTIVIQAQWNASFPESGAHDIVVLADPARTIVEVDWQNNRASKEVTYAAGRLPNLRLDQVTAATTGGAPLSQAKDGDTVVVSLQVVNDSPAPFLGGTLVEVRDGSLVVFSAPLPRMDPQQALPFSFNWTARTDAHLQVVVNAQGSTPESDYSDDTATLSLTVTAAPQSPTGLYIGAGGVAAAAVVAALFLVMRRRRSGAPPEVPAEGPAAAVAPVAPESPEAPPAEPSAEAPPMAPEASSELPPEAPAVAPEEAPPAATPGLCPKCGQPVEPEWALCPNCETPLR